MYAYIICTYVTDTDGLAIACIWLAIAIQLSAVEACDIL